MNISTISYWFYEAFESMKKNIKNVLISVSTMIATMIIIASRIYNSYEFKLHYRAKTRGEFENNGVFRT